MWAVLDLLEAAFHGGGQLVEDCGGEVADGAFHQRPDAFLWVEVGCVRGEVTRGASPALSISAAFFGNYVRFPNHPSHCRSGRHSLPSPRHLRTRTRCPTPRRTGSPHAHELIAAFEELDYALAPGLVHGDAYLGNCLWDGDHALLGDRDEAAIGPREVDLANYQGRRFGKRMGKKSQAGPVYPCSSASATCTHSARTSAAPAWGTQQQPTNSVGD